MTVRPIKPLVVDLGVDIDRASNEIDLRDIVRLGLDDGFRALFVREGEKAFEIVAAEKRRNAERAGVSASDDRFLRFRLRADQTFDHLLIHMRLIASENRNCVAIPQRSDPAPDGTADPAAPVVVRHEEDLQTGQLGLNSFGLSAHHNRDRCTAGAGGSFDCPSNEALAVKLKQLLRLAQPG